MGLYDVIIVGAGPAGLGVASQIEGKVLLIDKRKTPYKKIACAEWVPLSFPAKGVQYIERVVTVYPGGTVYNHWKGKIIDREKWQESIVMSLHCDIHFGEKVEWVEGGIVKTDKGRYKADWVIGADGAVSQVRRAIGIKKPSLLPAVNVRVKAKKYIKETHIYFMHEIEKGYGWYFPKGEYANIGVGCNRNLKKTLYFFIQFLFSKNFIDKNISSVSFGYIPLSGLLKLVKNRVILVGDAGGFTDPLTGAGLFQAWDAAREVARVIKGEISPKEYENLMHKTYGKFLKRRYEKRKILEEKWRNLKEAVEKSWISFFQE